MVKLEEDEFRTFIVQKDNPEHGIDLQKFMITIIQHHNFSVKEFWEMPLNLVLELLGLFTLPDKKPMSRKRLLDNERYWNQRNGI